MMGDRAFPRYPVRLRSAVSVAAAAAVLLTLSCSHRSPYSRADVLPAVVSVPVSEIQSRIVLVGDAGVADAPVLAEVEAWAARMPNRTMVVFLGDNMYPEGMTARRQHEAGRLLLPQIEAATRPGARALFVPGNHDWADGGDDGYDAILEQARYVTTNLQYTEGFLPADGCPGPAAIDPFDRVRVIALDTQWWLHDGPKPSVNCPHSDRVQVTEALTRLLDTDRHVVMAAHHPLFGYGRHSSFAEWREHVLPPVIGSLIVFGRSLHNRKQNYSSMPYREMVDAFRSALLGAPETDQLRVWTAGHDHSLEVLEGHAVDYVLISGSAGKLSPVTDGDETLFALSRRGFMVLDFMAAGTVLLRVVDQDGREVFTHWLRGQAAGARS